MWLKPVSILTYKNRQLKQTAINAKLKLELQYELPICGIHMIKGF